MTDGRLSRRNALRIGSVAALSSLAGCAGVLGRVSESTDSPSTDDQQPTTADAGAPNSGNATDGEESTGTTTTESETTGSGLDTHPGTAGLDSQPYLGADPESADAVIVAFEDPSCPFCQKFERDTFPAVEENLLAPKEAAFVFRGLGIVQEWGQPAAKALEATFARSESAHWALKEHYYAEQDSFTSKNVLSKTESFLAAETSVDGAAVRDAVEAGEADAAYRVDMDAAAAAKIDATPTFLLFRDGAFVTAAVGAVSYQVIATPLGV